MRRDTLRPCAIAVLSTLFVLVASVRTVATCTDYSAYLHWKGGTAFSCRGLATLEAPLDGYVLGADPYYGIRVVDVSPPARASIVAGVPTPSPPHAVDAVGSLALSVEEHAWRLVDVSDPLAPSVTYGLNPSTVVDWLSGTFDRRSGVDVAYLGWVAGYDSEIRVYDVTDPYSPATIASVPFIFDPARSVRYVEQTVGGTQRSYLYVASDGFYIIDVTDPGSPSIVVEYGLNAAGVTGADGYAYVAVGGTIRVLDVSDPSAPFQVALLSVPGTPKDLWLGGTNLYVSCGSYGVHVVDVQNPSSPTSRKTVHTPVGAVQARAVGSELLVGDLGRGIHVFDAQVLDPVPTLRRLDTPGSALRVELMGDYAFVADGGGGLQVFDIRNLDSPSPAGSLAPPGGGEFVDLKVSGQIAYVAGDTGGFHVIDVSDPTQPSVLSSTLALAEAVDVVGTHAYVSHSSATAGLTILDVSAAAAPTVVGSVSLPPNLAPHVAVIGDVAYVSSWNDGLWTIDVSDPAAPVQVGDLPGNYLNVVPGPGGLAFAVAFHQIYEVQVLDLSDPFQPAVVAHAPAGVDPRNLFLDGDVLYVACGRMGVHAIDVSDPLQPVNFGNVLPDSLPGANSDGALDLQVRGDRVLVASGSEGFAVVPTGCLSVVDAPVADLGRDDPWLTAMPNPFRESVDLGFTMERSGPVRVDVLDVRGRMVRRLVDGTRDVGRHSLSWSGRDRTGRPVAAGVYFVRTERAGEVRATRLVRLR